MPANTKPRPLVTLGYTRVSSEGQAGEDHYSLSTQEAAIRAYCRDHGYPAPTLFEDVHSGADFWRRPGMQALLAAAHEHAQQGAQVIVIAHALDRLSRQQEHVGYIVTEIERLAGRIELVTEKLEDTPTGKFLQGARAFAAEVQRVKILESTERGRRGRIASGKPLPGGRPLYGYRWVDAAKTRLERNPETAEIACWIFEQVLHGRTLRGIAEELRRRRVLSPAAYAGQQVEDPYRWHPASLRGLLTHPGYSGVWSVRRTVVTQDEQHQKHYTKQVGEQLSTPIGPALVSPHEFAQVQAILQHHRTYSPRSKYPRPWLLSGGLGRCACGGALGVRHPKQDAGPAVYYCYKAHKTHGVHAPVAVDAAALDASTWDLIVAGLTDADLLQQWAEDQTVAERAALSPTGRLDLIEHRLAEVNGLRTRLGKQLARFDPDLPEDEEAAAPLRQQLRDLAREQQHIEADRQATLHLVEVAEQRATTLRSVAEWAALFGAGLRDLSLPSRRAVLEALGVQVIWHPDTRQAELDIKLSRSRFLSDAQLAALAAETEDMQAKKEAGERADGVSNQSLDTTVCAFSPAAAQAGFLARLFRQRDTASLAVVLPHGIGAESIRAACAARTFTHSTPPPFVDQIIPRSYSQSQVPSAQSPNVSAPITPSPLTPMRSHAFAVVCIIYMCARRALHNSLRPLALCALLTATALA